MVSITLRWAWLATTAAALGACGTKPEGDQRAEIIGKNINSCVQRFEQRRAETPGVTPARLDSQRFCTCAVQKMAEGKSAEVLRARDAENSLNPEESRIVSGCLDEEARRAGVIEADAPAAPTAPHPRSATPATPATPARTPPAHPARSDHAPPPAHSEAAPHRPADRAATPTAPPHVTTPTVPPHVVFSPPPRPATPAPAPRTATPAAPPRPAPHPVPSHPAPEGN